MDKSKKLPVKTISTLAAIISLIIVTTRAKQPRSPKTGSRYLWSNLHEYRIENLHKTLDRWIVVSPVVKPGLEFYMHLPKNWCIMNAKIDD